MFVEAISIGAVAGLCIAVARAVRWFGPVALFLAVSMLGAGLMLDLYDRFGQGDAVYFVAPAVVFFGLGGPAALALKPFPGVKNYSAAVFGAACLLSLLAIGKLVAHKIG